MRFLVAALLGFVTAGVNAAGATEMPIGQFASYPAPYVDYGRPSPVLWGYDDEPGVTVRAWWSTPWRNRHYFPATGVMPRAGRYEKIPAGPAKPAKSYSRSWSNDSALDREQSAGGGQVNIQSQGDSYYGEDQGRGERRDRKNERESGQKNHDGKNKFRSDNRHHTPHPPHQHGAHKNR